jgi:hypothetical protein
VHTEIHTSPEFHTQLRNNLDGMQPQTIWTQRTETDCIVVMATYRIEALTEEKFAEIAKATNFDRSFTPEGSTCNSPCEVHEGDILE